MLTFYQMMLLYGGWRAYAIESVHGGIFGTIFGFSTIMILSTCFGEYLLVDKSVEERKKYMNYALIGAISFVVGLVLAFLPEWYANKRQVTMSYILISLGASILLSFIVAIPSGKLYMKSFTLCRFSLANSIVTSILYDGAITPCHFE